MENKKRYKRYIKFILIDILVAALISFFLINYVISAYKIEGHSMEPVLCNQDRIIISKIAVKNENIQRFNIVVLYKPDEPSKSIIKRIIGLPGEIIRITNGWVYIDKERLKESYLQDNEREPSSIRDVEPMLIPKGHYFVLGDNRKVSRDSRFFGVVPAKYIYGKAIFRYWPLSKMGSIE